MDKISIIIATFNAENTLKQALDSIKYQTYSNFELIIIDGGSTDSTMDVVSENDDIVSIMVSEKDKGIYDAFNKGIDLASGDYIYFMGADDCLYEYNTLESIANHIDRNDIVISFPVIVVDEESKTEYIGNNKRTVDQILSGNMLPHQGIFVKADIMKRYKFRDDYVIAADYDFIVRYSLNGGVVKYCSEPVAYYSSGGKSSEKYGGNNWIRFVFEHLLILKDNGLEDRYLVKTFKYLIFEDTDSISYFFFKMFYTWLRGAIYFIEHL